MKKLVRLIAFITLFACIACTAGLAEAFTVTDQAGRTVSFEKPAEKVVSCYYISTASILALDAEASLVGIEMKADTRMLYKMAAPQIISLPAVGSGKGINLEEIAALSPDVVILPLKLKDDAASLEELGINVIVVNPESQEQFIECIGLLGTITGREDNAGMLLEYISSVSDFVSVATADLERPSVYMSAGSDFFTTYPSGMFQDDLITIAGGANVAAGLEGGDKVTIDAEQLLAWNPEYIFIVSDADYTVEDVLGNSQLSELDAVKNGNVYMFPADIEAWDYPTPSSGVGQVYVASVLHPEVITAEDFGALSAQFYAEIYGFDVTSVEAAAE